MITIRPVSDLRNNFKEIEKTIQNGTPIYLTKNGYGTMVVMSLEQYTALTEDIEAKLDEADSYAKEHSERLTAEEVFSRVKQRIKNHEEL